MSNIYHVFVSLNRHDYNLLVKADSVEDAEKAAIKALKFTVTPIEDIPDYVAELVADDLQRIKAAPSGTVIVYEEGT